MHKWYLLLISNLQARNVSFRCFWWRNTEAGPASPSTADSREGVWQAAHSRCCWSPGVSDRRVERRRGQAMRPGNEAQAEAGLGTIRDVVFRAGYARVSRDSGGDGYALQSDTQHLSSVWASTAQRPHSCGNETFLCIPTYPGWR